MNEKNVSMVLVIVASITSLFFIVKQNVELAVFALMIMFTLTNYFRYRSFSEKGYVKEAKWMKGMSIFFAIAAIVVLYIILTK